MYISALRNLLALRTDAGNIALGAAFLAVGLCSFAALKVHERRKDKK